ncbi:ATPase, T2SS/T4P/T4SS family [Desulfovibrio sp.]|uniref:type IV pilus twitching motility protein PilT n=1 Tax=Desulfovibrio sp. TaxID=885 RepID=UPI0025C67412|nr:ATPase, T2SS/T4P/T4SS family [Desulfovibrio sp.]
MAAVGMYPDEPRIRWDYSDINALLLWATHCGMSDLCLRSGSPAWMRLNGVWRPVTQRPITADELLAGLERLTKNNSVAALIKSGQSDYDFAHQIEESRGHRRRYRGNATPVADGYATGVKIVFRAIPSEPPLLEDLHVEQGILDHATPGNGLVLVTGVMGSGKSTLLAALLRNIIEKGGRHVCTYESPIEFDFDAIPTPGGPVSQSTIPEHLQSFLTATRNSTRTAPDVVLIGESRDPETLRGMIESAEIGVAAYSTVHTRSVPETLTRIINVFPFEEQRQVTATLLSSLRLIISQRLLPLPDNSGRIALREYLAFTPEIREALLDTPPERLIQKTEELLPVSGQRIQEAAEQAYADGKISKDKYLAILAERKNTKGSSHGQTARSKKTVLRSVHHNRVQQGRRNQGRVAPGGRRIQKQGRLFQSAPAGAAVA